MKRLIAFLVFVVIAGVVALLLTTFPANRETIFPGYMEADLVLVGSEQGGRVETLSVRGGRQRREGRSDLHAGKHRAGGRGRGSRGAGAPRPRRGSPTRDSRCSGRARSRCSKLRSRKPRPCCRCNRISISTARRRCSTRSWVSKAQLDDVIAQHDRNQAAVAEAERRITAAKLPNRSDLIDAAAASVETARHSLEQAEKGLAKRKVFAPATGTVEEVYFRPGEVVNAGPGGDRASAAGQSQGPLLRGRAGARRACTPARPSRSVATAARASSPPRSASSRARPSSPRR